jgi:hypothetical protein
VGKTNITSRITGKEFNPDSEQTIGVWLILRVLLGWVWCKDSPVREVACEVIAMGYSWVGY